MTWGSNWQVAQCGAADGAGQQCSLADGHKGEHKTIAAVARDERSAWMWRVLIFIGISVVVAYGMYGIR